MSRYLISTRVLLDLAKPDAENRARQWLMKASDRDIAETDLYISAATAMRLPLQIEGDIARAQKGELPPPPTVDQLRLLQRNINKLIGEYEARERIVAMDYSIARRWGGLLDTRLSYREANGSVAEIGSVEKVEIATATEGLNGVSFTYVAYAQEAYATIPGLVVETP